MIDLGLVFILAVLFFCRAPWWAYVVAWFVFSGGNAALDRNSSDVPEITANGVVIEETITAIEMDPASACSGGIWSGGRCIE